MTDINEMHETLNVLAKEGHDILVKEVKKLADSSKSKDFGMFALQRTYQLWYSKALRVVEQILPDRYLEFINCYEIDKRKEINAINYTIKDYLLGVSIMRGQNTVVNGADAFISKINIQILIVEACNQRLDFTLSNLQGVVQADLFDNELEAAVELMKKGHLRAAGAVAGVTLERHLATVVNTKQIKLLKKDPTIAELNDALKKEEAIDVPNWRFIQRLGDLRNLSVHSKECKPTKDEIDELIKGAQKVVKTVF